MCSISRDIAEDAARNYLKNTFRELNTEKDVVIATKIGPGSVDLRGVYETQKLLANDTSFGVGFAPFTEAERITFETSPPAISYILDAT